MMHDAFDERQRERNVMLPQKNPENSTTGITKQGFRYLLIGGSSALVELLLFQGLLVMTPFSIAPSNVIAVVCATAYNFLLNRSFTFKSTSNPLRSLILYLLLFVANTTFSTLFIQWVTDLGGSPVVAKLFTMACIMLWNFVLYRKLIFK